MVEIKIEKPVSRLQRISIHSHIRGLGLDENGKAIRVKDGLVGQLEAREAAGIVVEMVKEGRMAGRGVLFVGPSGTGKTAIAIGIARELGEDTPFVAISGSEIYSSEIKKTEFLMQAIRRAIGVRIRETRRVYEGVVKEVSYQFEKNPFMPYAQIPVGGVITLETEDDEARLRVPEEVAQQLIRMGVKEGDYIELDEETGHVRRIGRVKSKSKEEYDVGGLRSVEMPKGSVKKVKETVHTVTLNDLDVIAVMQRAAYTSLFGFLEAEKEVSPEVRKSVDEQVKKMVETGKAEIVPGVLFIDDAHMLDLEAYSFLTRAIEGDLAPILVLATNRGLTKIRGTDVESPHGIPLDLLDRLLIIPTKPYDKEDIREIIKIRSDEEDIPITEEALEMLTEIGATKSLRYAVQLMEPARIIAKRENRVKVEPKDVERAAKLFADTSKSLRITEE
ncbi:MAG: RuvB-like domain-containing protein, partial [Desulfurococcales archaeon]|nr:RuvB-like domain-containing protein [Desulfurococcales archaeon]